MNPDSHQIIQRVRCGELELAVQDTGKGEPLLLLHGFPLNRRMWIAQTAALSSNFRCIAPDLRGFGESGSGGPWTMDQYADDLACILDQLGVDSTTICGLSMGGYVAFAFWRRHPERVRALVLADTRAGNDDEAGREKRRGTIATAREKGAAAVAEQSLAGLLGKSTRERDGEPVSLAKSILEDARVEGIVGGSEAMIARPDSTPTLATITVPTLVVVGEEDTLTPVKDARAMAAAIPDAKLEVIPRAGHLSNIERPAAFTSVLHEFLDSLPPASGS